MEPKDLVAKFYQSSGILSKEYCKEVLHKKVMLEWHSSKGVLQLDLDDILALSKDLRQSYFALRTEINRLYQDGNHVTICYSHFVRTLENPDEELPLADFFAIWEVKDGKMIKGYQMSQLSG